ncbi:MAG: VWA domain-containing protein [Verrucomicrobiota bacterium]
MRFDSPQWLLLVPVLIALAFWYPRLKLWEPWRALVALCLVVALAQLSWQQRSGGLDLWVLVDRSASAEEGIAQRIDEWEAILKNSKGNADRIQFIDYAEEAMLRGDQETMQYTGGKETTNTALAIRDALGRAQTDRSNRLLVLTDGYSTVPMDQLGRLLRQKDVALDYRLTVPESSEDYQVADLRLPTRVRLGEPFLVEVVITGNEDGEIPYQLSRNGQELIAKEAEIVDGETRLRFTDRIDEPGGHQYQMAIAPETDALAGNNQRQRWIEVASGPRLLVITSYPDDPVADSLKRQGFLVEVITDPRSLGIGNLSGARGVIFNNIPAHLIPADFLEALKFFVRGQGGGVMMVGGEHSFGAGGYFQSPLDDIMPVSMELRMEHRKLSVAMAIVMDRSGSMGATVAGSMPSGFTPTKMDLANSGAAGAIELLGPQDAITVFAVDSEPHTIVPLTQIGPNPAPLTDMVRKIAPGGGGIFVYNGLQAGWKELQKSEAGTRHMILFSDAQDSEQPGGYKKLVEEMVKEGVTVSVIGLGHPADIDADFLRDIADRGNGRIFFNDNAGDLPTIFAQETVAIARSAFIDEPVGMKPTASWLQLAARPFAWPPEVDGYNLSYLRPEASSAANTTDEYNAPLIAFWQRGAGRAAAVSFPLGGKHSALIRAWPQYGDFVQTMGRWVIGNELPPGIGIRTKLRGTQLDVELLHDDSWTPKLATRPPRLQTAFGNREEGSEQVWQRMAPGHYQATLPMRPQEVIRGVVQVGEFTLPFGPYMAGSEVEWSRPREALEELKAVSRLSGGGDRLELSEIWDAPRPPSYVDLSFWFLLAALLFLLLDVLWTRLGLGFGPLDRWAAPRGSRRPDQPATA